MPTPTTVVSVREFLGLSVDDPADPGLTSSVDAVNALVASWRPLDPTDTDYSANIRHGATMLAARIWRRRNSPAGVESYGDLGPTYVRRNDPDVAILLGMGYYTRPEVG